MSMSEWNVNNARMQIMESLNRNSDDFPELRNEIFYYDKMLKCFTSKKGVKGK
jgi:hypothetical protein